MPIERMPGRRRLYIGERVSVSTKGTIEHGTVVVLLDRERVERDQLVVRAEAAEAELTSLADSRE